MRIRLTHKMALRYPEGARSLTTVLRLSPRSHDGQRVMRWRIDVEPDCRLKASEDHHGNLIHTLTIPGPAADPRITVTGELATYDVAGVVLGAPDRLPLEVFVRDTPATRADADLRYFATKAVAIADDRIGAAHALMGALHAAMRLDDDVATRPCGADALAAGSGTAEDFAHVFLASARFLGWPSRCVTGYHVPHDATQRRHAWAEVQVDGLGWVAFDPVHDICPKGDHIRTAVGFDAIDAASLRSPFLTLLSERLDAVWRFETPADAPVRRIQPHSPTP